MSAESEKEPQDRWYVGVDFKVPFWRLDNFLEETSDDELIKIITRSIKSDIRRIKAARQIKIYFNKIASHPEMRSLLIKKVIELVQYEKIGVKNE